MLAIILFFLTLLIDNVILELILVLVALLLTWFITKKIRLSFAGLGIILLAGGSLFLLDHYIIKSLGNESLILITLLVTGITIAYYIYQKKAFGVLVIYLFLLGSVCM